MKEKNNNFHSNDIIKKIRSKYIQIKLFDNLEEKTLLNIVHYNKKYQKFMHKKIKDYKDEYSKIKIEIIPKENSFGEFINFKSKYKIYFNDNKEEIKRDFITKEDNVNKIKIIIIVHKITSLSRFFIIANVLKK